ncbi:Outer membrane receptor proteins, mostly Fe transport [Flavobacteriaceae bacterium MAR_2010_188]|nr:Outer membrane receptor proteins, mostly Fe transport [Flavobacteriaceae bacterium MAR_2010_188]
MKILLFCVFLFAYAFSFSQSKSFKITGKILAENDSIPLESATVYLERVKDSSLVTYTITDRDGLFSIIEETYDDKLNLTVSYIGYKNYSRQLTIDKEVINLGRLNLQLANNLDEITIRSRAPITVKKDTLEFNVKSFKTKKDANVEDLLKQLPGVEVDDDGKITVNGKAVNKILVNGKPFFGGDPTITTRNLTKEIINKVQITDTKTKSEAFAGEEGDKENKTINLTIKEENNKGIFGRFSAGAGTDKRYEFAGLVNVFDNDQRISILAGGNNTNSPGFSFGEIQKMFGGGRSVSFSSNGNFAIDERSFGGGEGITTSTNVGANYADELNKEVDLTGDYFYSSSRSDNETKIERENILPDTRYFTNSNSVSSSDTDNHSMNLQFEIETDSTFLINLEPSFQFTKSVTNYKNLEETLNENLVRTNTSDLNSLVMNTGKNFSNEFNVTKKFGAGGAFLKFSLDTEFNDTESDDYIESQTIFTDENQNIIRDQYSDDHENLKSLYTTLTYRIPLISKAFFLDLKYGIRNDKRENLRSTYDFDPATGEYSSFNLPLSTDFNYTNKRSTPAAEISYRKEDWSFSLNSGYVFRTLENSDELRPELNLTQKFEALELGSNFYYKFSPKSSINIGYNLSNQPPQLFQLRPFQNVSNPLNIITGNPNLKPSNNQNIYLSFNSFDFQKRTGFFGYFNGGLTSDQIVSKTSVDPETLIRRTTYTNVDGVYQYSGSMSYSKTVKLDTMQSVRYRIGFYGNSNRDVNFNNEVKYASNRYSVTPNIRLTYTWDKVAEIEPNYRLNYTRTRYDLDQFNDQEFINHSLGIRTATFVPKGLEWRNDINFSYNPNIAPGFQKTAWFWNSTLAYSIMQEKATITLKVYDLLNQNTNARRSATDNYIQDIQSTVLQQYFMLSFSWKFNTLGSKGETGGNHFMMF